MSNRHRKKQRPQTVDEFIKQKIREIQGIFTVPMRITIVARYAPDPDAELIFTDDNLDHVIALMTRRRDAVLASQAGSAASTPATDEAPAEE